MFMIRTQTHTRNHNHIQIVVCLHMQIAHTPRDARLCIWHWQLAKEESAPASVFALPKFINQKANASSKRNNIYLCICLFAFSHLHTHKVKFPPPPLSLSLYLHVSFTARASDVLHAWLLLWFWLSPSAGYPYT